MYVYSFILVAAIWRCHNFTGFVASAKTVLENHVHVLKQFEAAVALPSTGHVQVSVPWDTCSQPQGVSTLCRCVGLDRMINQLAIPFGSSLEWKKGPWDLDFCGAHFRMKAAVPETKIFRRAEWQHYIRRQGRVTITKITKCPTDDLRLILTVKCFVTLWSGYLVYLLQDSANHDTCLFEACWTMVWPNSECQLWIQNMTGMMLLIVSSCFECVLCCWPSLLKRPVDSLHRKHVVLTRPTTPLYVVLGWCEAER